MTLFEKEFVFKSLPKAEQDKLQKQVELIKEFYPNAILSIYDLIPNGA